MPYIGNQPSESFTSFATQEFSTSATTSYTLDHAVTNENEIALFINNVRQQPGSGKAYTATGTALTLSAATASTDTMYCVFLGRALQTVNPATNSITAAMVSNDLISGKTALASEPADTDEFLVSDAGTLKRIDYSLIKGGGMNLLSTTTISSTPSSVAFDNTLITSTYDNYVIIGSSLEPTADLNLGFGVSTDNGSSGTAQEYNNSRYLQLNANTQGFNSTTVSVNSVNGPLIGELNDGKLGCFVLQIFNTQATVRGTYLRYESIYENASGVPYSLLGATIFSNTSAINHVQVATSTSTFQSGTVSLYGMKK